MLLVEVVHDKKTQEDADSVTSETLCSTMLNYSAKSLNHYWDAFNLIESESERKFRSQFFILVCVILFNMTVLYVFNFSERFTTVVICFLLSETRTVIAGYMRCVREMRMKKIQIQIQSEEGALKKAKETLQHQLRYSKM